MASMQMKIEVIFVSVSDVDSAKAFYTEKVGFNADYDQRVNETLRFVQLTPPGSACSIAIGTGISTLPANSSNKSQIQIVVEDVRAIREELAQRGVDISEIDVQSWGDFAYFSDPDGNSWAFQQLPKRG